MSDASRLVTSPLLRQNALHHESGDSREEGDSAFAEITVADEIEARSEAVRLMPVAGPPRRLVADALHRRNHSVGEQAGPTGEKKDKDAYRKCSEGNQMTEPPTRKSLSESRGVQLGKIELIPAGEAPVHRSFTAPCDMERRPYPETLTNTPLGYSMNESMPPMTANEQSTVNITVQFSYPYVTLPEPYQKSESAPQPYFVPMILPVQGGKLANAEFLLAEVAKEFDVDMHYASEALAVWMISDLLEVQLKPHHSPYGVGECWASLLKKFTSASADDIAEDCPLVMVKRRVQLSVTREQEIMAFCPRIREILFNDAYEAFMSGRYAPSVEESAELAGLALSAAFEPYVKDKHGVEFLRQEMESFVPRHLVSTIKGPLVFGRALNGPNSLESLLLKSWRESPQTLADVHTRFLEKLHDKPYYGAAFFPGSIERPKKKWSLSGGASDIRVLVGINETFVSVLDEAKKEILLVQRIRDCTWNRIDPQPSGGADDVEPSLLLTFPDDADTRAKATKVLQIFGRQAVMINALLIAMASQLADDDLMEEDSGAELSDGGCCNGDYSNSGYSHSVPSTSRSIPARSSMATSTASSPTSSSPPKTASSTSSSGAHTTSTVSHSSSGHQTTTSSRPSSTVSRVPSLTRHNKLCLATFDQAGVCLQAQGSLKVVFKGTASQA